MSARRSFEEALAIWDLDAVQTTMWRRYLTVALRLRATELQAVVVSLREVGVAWKRIALSLDNTIRTCTRSRRNLLDILGVDEARLSQYLRGDRDAPRMRLRRRTPQGRPFRRLAMPVLFRTCPKDDSAQPGQRTA